MSAQQGPSIKRQGSHLPVLGHRHMNTQIKRKSKSHLILKNNDTGMYTVDVISSLLWFNKLYNFYSVSGWKKKCLWPHCKLHCFGTLRNSAGYFVPFSSRLLHTLTGWTPRTPASTSSSEWEQFQCFLNVFTDSWTHTQGEQKARPFGSQLLDYLWREYCTNHEKKKKTHSWTSP